MTTIDAMIKELYETGKTAADSMEHNGRLPLAVQIRLQETLARAEKFMADNKEAPSNGANKGKARKPARFYLLKHLMDLLKPFVDNKSSLDILKAIHVNGKAVMATDLENVIEVKFNKGWLGADCSISLADVKRIENAPLGSLVDSVKTCYTGQIEYKLDKDSEEYKTATRYTKPDYDIYQWQDVAGEFESEQALQAFIVTEHADLEIRNVTVGRQDVVTVKDGNKSFTLAGLDPRERPTFDEEFKVDWQADVSMEQIETMARVAICAATDDSRPILKTVSVKGIQDGQARLFAADGFRMMTDVIDAGWPDSGERLIPAEWPGKVLKTMKKLGVDKGKLEFGKVGDSKLGRIRVTFEAPEMMVRITTVLVEGKSPDYQQIIPKKGQGACTVTMAMARAREIAKEVQTLGKGICNEAYNKTTWHFEPNSMALNEPGWLKVSYNGEAAAELMFQDLDIQGDAAEMAYNFQYLADCLTCLDGDKVTIQVGADCTRPTRLDSNNGTSVIMPMHLNR